MSYDDDEDLELYGEDGKITPYGLAVWADNEGGLVGLIERGNENDLIEAGMNECIVKAAAYMLRLLDEEAERIGAVL